MNRSSSYETREMVAPSSTCMPSRANTSATRAPASGSTGPSRCGPASITVTRTPKRARAWASSAPIGPPPMTPSVDGRVSIRSTSRLVQNGVSARPSIGGVAGRVPVLSTTPVAASNVSPSTATVRGPVSRPCPRTNRTPASSSRLTATVSSQSSVASSRIRACTGAQSARTSALPARPSMRRPSASRFAARITILLGMHPKYGHSPPTRRSSTPTTESPAFAS